MAERPTQNASTKRQGKGVDVPPLNDRSSSGGASSAGREAAIKSLEAAGFAVTSIKDSPANRKETLNLSIDLSKYKSSLEKRGSDFRDAIAGELSKRGIDPALSEKLDAILVALESEAATPRIPDRLRRKLPRFMAQIARAAFETAVQTGVPERRWERDKANYPTAEAFLREVYGPRLGTDGDLTFAEIQRLDSPLASALDVEFRGAERRKDLHRLLPTPTERADARLERRFGYIPTGRDRKTKLMTLGRETKPRP